MSDYFSLGNPANNDHGNNERRALNVPMSGDTDCNSVHSGDSQYLMEMGPDSNTPAEYTLAPSTISGISAAAISPSPFSKDSVLPKTDPKSPYYVNVPVPKALPTEASSGSSSAGVSTGSGATAVAGDSESNDGQYVREYPTDILVDRFYKWRKILKGLIAYLKEVAYAQEQFARINYQLKSSVKFPFLTDLEEGTNKLVDPLSSNGPARKQQPLTLAQQKQQQQDALAQQQKPRDVTPNESNVNASEYDFQAIKSSESDESSAASGFMKFGSGSIQDTQVILKKYHLSLANQQLKISKEITASIVPKMEDLRKDLQLKIKEIKDLHGDFKTNINEHVAITGQLLNKYIASVRFMNTATTDGSDQIKLHKKNNQLKAKHDPYLLKLQLDLQLKRQMLEENYLQEAFINLQSSGMELEKIVYSKIQHSVQRYCILVDSEARLMIKNLCRELQQGLLSRPPALEWDHFVSHQPTCLLNWKSNDPIPRPRKLSDIVYPQMKSPLAKCIRAGYLTKKSKYLKNYNKGYFVLTSNYLHEFKSSNFFKLSADSPSETKDNQNVPISSQSSAKTSLVPVMSISLNDCILTETSDTKFTLVGKPTFNDIDFKRVGPSAKNSSTNVAGSLTAPSLYMTAHDAPKKLKKTAIGMLLKGGKSKSSSSGAKREEPEEVKEFYAAAQQESNKTVNWVFKPASSNPTEEDIRQFKKWAHDLKNLTTFNNTKDRARYIEERALKTQSRVRGFPNKPNMGSSNMMTLLDGSSANHVDPSSFRKERPGRPQYIQLQNSSASSSALDLASQRSRVNTPAVDDNGNLITFAERRNVPGSLAVMSPGLASPRYSPNSNSESSSSVSSMQQHQLQPQQQQSGEYGVPISSPGVSPTIATVTSGTPVGKSRHRRNVSQTHSLPVLTPPLIPSVNSPKSVHSDGSMGGYFAIPVKSHNDSSQSSSPSYTDDQVQQNALSRTSSRGTAMGMRSTSGGYSPQLLGMMAQQPSSIPKVRLNDQDVTHHADQALQRADISAPQIKMTKNTGASDVPTVRSESTINNGNPSLYLRSNHSANSLNTNPSRVHPIRKHKKNVSFSSLNSLMFSKKSSNPGGSHMTDQFMSGGIQEDDDGEGNSQSVKLNQSIYS